MVLINPIPTVKANKQKFQLLRRRLRKPGLESHQGPHVLTKSKRSAGIRVYNSHGAWEGRMWERQEGTRLREGLGPQDNLLLTPPSNPLRGNKVGYAGIFFIF